MYYMCSVLIFLAEGIKKGMDKNNLSFSNLQQFDISLTKLTYNGYCLTV